MSCASSWRLYPERSITSHRFCGSERLLPGLLERETRRAERMTGLMIELMLWRIPTAERGQDCSGLPGCQDNSESANITRGLHTKDLR